MTKLFTLVILVLGLHSIKCDYIAGVVEHNNVAYSTPNITIEENVKLYIYHMEKAKTLGVNIIVFPEYGLTGLQVNPENYSIEIPNVGESNFKDIFLTRLSSAALEHGMYLVVNLLEKAKNENNDTIYYNTNVVFDRLSGAIVAKYRKINLFDEPKLTAGPANGLATFTTDFDVTFGLMTCADVLFYNPSRTIAANGSVTDVIFPHAWTSLLPFYMSVSVQSAYAISNRVNLLAANLNNPSAGMGGSGIYTKYGNNLRRYLSGTPSSSLIVANVPTGIEVRDEFGTYAFGILDNITGSDMANYATKMNFEYDRYMYKPLSLTQENIVEEICDGSFCCIFNLRVSLNETNSTEVYKLMAFNGPALIGDQRKNIKHCNLIACVSDDISTCGNRPARALGTKFREISVTGNFENTSDNFFQPSTLRGDLLPVTNITYLQTVDNSSFSITLNTTKTEENVVLFGIYGNSASSLCAGFVFVIAIFSVVY